MTTPSANVQLHTVEVERILPGGVGLARIDGRSVLLEGTAPGDVVEVELAGKRARVRRIVSPSADRIVPVCQDVGPCGGCDLMHMSYLAQLDAKRGMLEDCLRRIGKLSTWPEITVVDSPLELGYRWRASFHLGPDGSLGYMGRRSNRVVPIRRCHVLDPALETWRANTRPGGTASGARITAMTDGERVSVAGPGTAEVLEVPVHGERFLAAADGFFQANSSLVERMVVEVVRMAGVDAADRVLDLYAGAGLFSIPLARTAASVAAVESGRRSVELLRRHLVEAKITNVAIHQQLVEVSLARRKEPLPPTVVVLDPPRDGAGDEVVGRIAELGPVRVVMVSCDPATFARDVRAFAQRGYGLRELTLLDMFPQTHHLEVVSLLEPTNG